MLPFQRGKSKIEADRAGAKGWQLGGVFIRASQTKSSANPTVAAIFCSVARFEGRHVVSLIQLDRLFLSNCMVANAGANVDQVGMATRVYERF